MIVYPKSFSMQNAIKLEILSINPITFKHCQHCEQFFDRAGIGPQVREQIISEYPADLLEDSDKLSAMVVELAHKYQNNIEIKVIDPQSPLGVYKSLRYWVRKYPTFIIDGKEVITGINQTALEHALQACLGRR